MTVRSADFPQIVAPVRYADGGALPTLRAGQDAYGASIQQVNAGVPPPPSERGGMSQTDFAGRGKPDADKIARQQEQLRKMLEARGKPERKARGGKIHPAIHHHIAHALIKLAEGGTVDEHAHLAALSPYSDDPEPSEKQKHVGNYRHGHTNIGGLRIAIENPAGSKRRPEWPELKSHYGRLKSTVGADSEGVDVFVKPGTKLSHGGPVHVIDQLHPNGTFDEHKSVVGAKDKAEALALYNENYTPGWQGAGAITEMPLHKFKAWVMDGVKSAPIARKSFTRAEGGDYLCKGGLT